MVKLLGGVILGFIAANIIGLIEVGILLKITKDIKIMLKQFKSEGKSDKWLK